MEGKFVYCFSRKGGHVVRYRVIARLFRAFAEASALETIALKAVTVCIIVILHRPKARSKTKDNQECLSRRLPLWTEGNITSLLEEGRTIQARLKFHTSTYKPRNLMRSFADLMFRGKVRDALKLLSESDEGGPLSLSDTVSDSPPTTVFDVLKSKHPPAQPTHPETIINKNLTPPPVHPVIFTILMHTVSEKLLLTPQELVAPPN